MPTELAVKPDAVRVAGHNLQLYASDLLGVKPLQSERQQPASDASAPQGLGHKNFADAADRCGAEVRRQGPDAAGDEPNNFTVLLGDDIIRDASEKGHYRFEPCFIG